MRNLIMLTCYTGKMILQYGCFFIFICTEPYNNQYFIQ
jgi:hypothetical protein